MVSQIAQIPLKYIISHRSIPSKQINGLADSAESAERIRAHRSIPSKQIISPTEIKEIKEIILPDDSLLPRLLCSREQRFDFIGNTSKNEFLRCFKQNKTSSSVRMIFVSFEFFDVFGIITE